MEPAPLEKRDPTVVGWALLELSLNDPDYDSVAREVRDFSPFSDEEFAPAVRPGRVRWN